MGKLGECLVKKEAQAPKEKMMWHLKVDEVLESAIVGKGLLLELRTHICFFRNHGRLKSSFLKA